MPQKPFFSLLGIISGEDQNITKENCDYMTVASIIKFIFKGTVSFLKPSFVHKASKWLID